MTNKFETKQRQSELLVECGILTVCKKLSIFIKLLTVKIYESMKL